MDFARDVSFRLPLCRGEDVRAIQQALTILQSTPPCGTVDGIFGSATQKSVSWFQQASQLSPTGIVDKPTWEALFKQAADRQKQVSGGAASVLVAAAAKTAPADMPVRRDQAIRARDWLFTNFLPQIEQAVQGTPLDPNLVAAIACKETANVWLDWIKRLSPDEVLARCVFDASGDYPGTSRSAFPRNAQAFREKVGDALTDALIAEANEMRKVRGWGPERWLYKGYGLFQYDLQHYLTDPGFFENREWRKFDVCLDKLMLEMKRKLEASNGDLPDAIRRYNGSGPKAEQYRGHVLFIYAWLKDAPFAN
ncbi:MAG: peptidoglycan-binding protein [Oxalobacteraceae bacterium]|nr:MAG: peptidoglycan-binding protein [Oxalobacteraceae bacterium]